MEIVSVALLVASICLVAAIAAVSSMVSVFLWPKLFLMREQAGCAATTESWLLWMKNAGAGTWFLIGLAAGGVLIVKEWLIPSRAVRVAVNALAVSACVAYLALYVCANLGLIYDHLLTLGMRIPH
jgi:hypothetical protein